MDNNIVDEVVGAYSTYDEYLSSQVDSLDLRYIQDDNVAMQLVELGFRGTGDVVTRETFETKKALANVTRKSFRAQNKNMYVVNMVLTDPFMQFLFDREEGNRTGKNCTIIFIRDKNHLNQEISGYIDYAHRLATEDFQPYFLQKKKLLPKPSDLSYYNWEMQNVFGKSSPNYELVESNVTTLLFRNKLDRKILDVDPKAITPGASSVRTVFTSKNYTQLTVFDHFTRRRF